MMSFQETGEKQNVLIRREVPADYRKTEELVRDAFWDVYQPGCNEHYLLHCFRHRAEFIPELDLVMEKAGRIIGQIMYVHSTIEKEDGTSLPAMTFGPVSVHPAFSRQGYGTELIRCSMRAAADLGAGALVITGSPAFYGKFGFVPGKTVGIRYRDDPETEYLLVKELKDGYLRGVRGTYAAPEGYFAAEKNPEDFQRFESRFPPREKRRGTTRI